MRVKFYKGPWHGKTKEISHFMPHLVVNSMPGKLNAFRNPSDMLAPITFKTHMYRPVRMSDGMGGVAYAMHPDGSIFYVCEGK